MIARKSTLMLAIQGVNGILGYVGTMVGNDVFIGPGALAQGEIQPETFIE